MHAVGKHDETRERVEAALDYYVDHHTEESTLRLLKALAHPSQGGFGYRIEMTHAGAQGDTIDERGKVIELHPRGLLAEYHAKEVALSLQHAIDNRIFGSQRSLAYRLGAGAGKVVLAAVETAIGAIGILVPEPGATLGSVALTMLGRKAAAAELADAEPPEVIARLGFHLGSLAMGSAAAIRVLQVPGNASLRMGAGVQPDDSTLDLWRGLPTQSVLRNGRDNLAILDVATKHQQNVLRFVIHHGRLYVNGRVIDTNRVRVHESSWKVLVRGLLDALWKPDKTR